MKRGKELRIGVVLLLDDEASKKAVSLSYDHQVLAKKSQLLLQAEGKRLPHISLYHLNTRYPQLVTHAVDHTLAQLGQDMVIGGKFQYVLNHGRYLFWETECSPSLMMLHTAIVFNCNAARTSAVEAPWAGPEYQRGLDHFGHARVLSKFVPHVTLTALDEDAAANYGARECVSEWRAKRIAVCRMGDFGTIEEILHKFDIGSLTAE